MTTEFAVLLAASFGLGLLTAYSRWVEVREIFLREDMFKIRDNLWDYAANLGRLDDPAYVQTRRSLNNYILAGPYMSLPILFKARTAWGSHAVKDRTASDCAELEQALQDAERAAGARIWRYVSRDRPWSFWSWLFFIGGRRAAKTLFCQWLGSNGPKQVARLAEFEKRPLTPSA